MNKIGYHPVRKISNSGLKVVQPSKLSNNKSGSHISRNKDKAQNDAQKIHLSSEYSSNKQSSVELGGTGINIFSKRSYKEHEPVTLKNIKHLK